ncbi:MAG: helix-turn-helix transcriptional regulator [Lachnospiraceae bacterium]|nr:helix-turn-helix transcriptional regulator [Lachnospiraceae bacterium]
MIKVNYVGYETVEENYTRIHRPQGSGDYLLVYFLTPMHISRENDIAVAMPGSVMLFEPGREQDFSAIREFKISYVHFTVRKDEMDSFRLPIMEVFYPEEEGLVNQYIDQINKEFNTRDFLFEYEMDSLLRNLFVRLSRSIHARKIEEENNTSLYNLFCQARYMMLSNCEKEWASTNMPEMVSLKRSQFYKYYTEFFGISPMADLNRARIEKAKSMLTNEDVNVTDVAAAVGYSSIHHFSRTFKDHTGFSPLQYVRNVTGGRKKGEYLL